MLESYQVLVSLHCLALQFDIIDSKTCAWQCWQLRGKCLILLYSSNEELLHHEHEINTQYIVKSRYISALLVPPTPGPPLIFRSFMAHLFCSLSHEVISPGTLPHLRDPSSSSPIQSPNHNILYIQTYIKRQCTHGSNAARSSSTALRCPQRVRYSDSAIDSVTRTFLCTMLYVMEHMQDPLCSRIHACHHFRIFLM